VIHPKPVRTVRAQQLKSFSPREDIGGASLLSYFEGILDQIDPRPTSKHITIFTDIATFGLEGVSSPGVLPGGRYAGSGLSVISSGTLHPSNLVVAHEWGHSFGLLGHFIEAIPNLMNSVFVAPSLTSVQRKTARAYTSQYYPR
jgi:hypothetical protein